MNPQQLNLVRVSLADAADREAVASRFLDLLVQADPAIGPLFHHREATRLKVAEELGLLLASLGDLDRFEARAHSLGARHRRYGVTSRHYAAASDALVVAVTERLGPESTPEVAAAWRAAFDLIAETMMEGGAAI